MTTVPTFQAFFEALHHGRSPFPWQVRLAAEVLATGWPSLLDLPTGVGKTSALDVALYCLAVAPSRMPRRTLLVVDRRVVVDQGAEHARGMLSALTGATAGPLRTVADALRSLWGAGSEDPPFAVAVMRGGMPRDNDWAKRPDQPVLGVSTVDQVGSRLLFRGYGVGPRSASIQAGLLGNDTLILLDEVHLAVPFAQTLAAIRSRLQSESAGLPARFAVVEMSATPRAGKAVKAFSLDADDREHPVLQQRLGARKLVKLVSLKVSGDDEARKREQIAKRVVEAALELQRQGAKVVGVVVNRVDTARLAHRLLKDEKQTENILVTGRMRAIERDDTAQTDLLPRAGAGRSREKDRPFVVVATQCIEAGADLDFDAMVTECASIDALRQRFGRVDRRGDLGTSNSVLIGRSDLTAPGKSDPIYGGALASTWQWLETSASDGVVDFGIAGMPAVTVADGTPRLDLLAPVEDAPILLPAHLDALAQTSPRPRIDPDIALWLHGPQRVAADVQVLWRTGIDDELLDVEALVEKLGACRPSSLETITIPLTAAKAWLAREAATAIADVVGGDADEDEDDWRTEKSRSRSSVALRWVGDDSEAVEVNDVRPGDVLIVDCARGGLTARCFDPDSVDPVDDLGDLAQLRGRGVATLRLQPAALAVWQLPAEVMNAVPALVDEESPAELRERVWAWIHLFPEEAPAGFIGRAAEWRAARSAWASKRMRVALIGTGLVITAPVARSSLAPEISDALTEDDDSSFRQQEVTLAAHSTDVRDYADRFGQAVGFGTELAEDLALAGWLHDVGKADPRFQRWLVGGSEVRASVLPEPLAKSGFPSGNVAQRRQARARAGYPDRCRHELMSLEMVQASEALLARAHDRDLVLHLVASHHGWCRPFAPPMDDPDSLAVELMHGDVQLSGTTRHHLARLDSGVSDRFWSLTERYGWWGLAWLEAVLRLADHRASERAMEETR